MSIEQYPARLEARRLIRARWEQLIAENVLKATERREAGEVVTEFYHADGEDNESKNTI